ncbi:AbrB/MazE/SpoVT family DNA-binding domain-containing protein [Candidatus Gottesmanbacteria bacterium]|nr:AbrB/MazE/SpoVT family DNA-binding domain-containing protein [Candidatus Gottesmanbacteria bacterium]
MIAIMTITSKGQVTFPKKIRETLGVSKGDRIIVKVEDNKVILEPAGKGILDFAGKFPPFKIPKGKTVDDLISEATIEYGAPTIR